MSRSLKKGPYVDENLLGKITKFKKGDQAVIKTWARDSDVSPEMVGFLLGIHNGRDFITVLITEDMVGHKLGEFAPTRKFLKHGGRMAREEEQAAAQKEAAKVSKPGEAEKESEIKKKE